MDEQYNVTTEKDFWRIYRKNPNLALRLIREYVRTQSVGHIELKIQYQEELASRNSRISPRLWAGFSFVCIVVSTALQFMQVKGSFVLTAWVLSLVVFLVMVSRLFDSMSSSTHSVYAYFLRDAQNRYIDRVVPSAGSGVSDAGEVSAQKPDAHLF